jgi:hypothetical protein
LREAHQRSRNPKLGIAKNGEHYLRSLLVKCAHFVLSRAPDSALKRWVWGWHREDRLRNVERLLPLLENLPSFSTVCGAMEKFARFPVMLSPLQRKSAVVTQATVSLPRIQVAALWSEFPYPAPAGRKPLESFAYQHVYTTCGKERPVCLRA